MLSSCRTVVLPAREPRSGSRVGSLIWGGRGSYSFSARLGVEQTECVYPSDAVVKQHAGRRPHRGPRGDDVIDDCHAPAPE